MKYFTHAALALAMTVLASVFVSSQTEAAQVSIAAGQMAVPGESLVERVQARCFFANQQCRFRFGAGPDYRRCMARRNCGFRGPGYGAGRFCGRQRARCRDRFGFGPDFRRCMRRAGC